MSSGSNISLGAVTVVTSSNGGHSLDYFARRIVDRLIAIGDDAPQPIRDQAYAFRERMLAIVLDGLHQARASDRAYLLNGKG